MSQSAVEIAGALRRFVRAENPDAPKVLPGLLAALAELPADFGAAPQNAAAAGEIACLLFTVVRTQRDVSIMSRALQALASLGRYGRSLAGQHIQARSLPLPQVTPVLQALPPRDYLALVNEMLLSPLADDKQFTAWIKGLVPAPGRCDPKGALQFLGALADEGTPLARPMRDALLSACMAEVLPKAFAGKPGPAMAEALLKASELLASPAVQQEALGYAVRAAGTEGPGRLGPLLAAPPDLAVREPALISEMRRLATQADAPKQLLQASRGEPEILGLVLADLLRQGGAGRATALRLAPLLPRLGLEPLLADIAEDQRRAVLGRLFLVLARHDPDYLRRAAKAMQAGLDPAVLQALAGLLAAQLAQDEAESAALLAPPARSAAPKPAAARRPTLAEALKDALSPLKDQDFSQSSLNGETLEGSTLTSVNLAFSQFTGVTFRRIRLSSSALQGSRFENCRFEACVLAGVDLCDTRFEGCRFEACAFERCDAARMVLTSTILAGCSLAECCLAGAHLAKSRLERLTARASAFSGLRSQGSAWTHCLFARCDLTGVVLERSAWRGAEFQDSTLTQARLRHCEALGALFTRCTLTGLGITGGHTDNPHLSAARTETLAGLLRSETALAELPEPMRTEAGAAFVAGCVGRFVRLDEVRRTLGAMRGQNQRRTELALERLAENQGVFLRLLPQLLATDVFEKAQGLKGVPACSVGGPEVRVDPALLEKYFPGQQPGEAAPVLGIEALYAIGSLGSVAQKPSSDIDCWVCHTEPAAGPGGDAQAVREGLRRKLAALEVWADQQFGLEVHFFAMTLAETCTNAFGMSDKESSGSAQAALLKEEFYRTALRLAGRDLLWWAVPPGTEAQAALALLSDLTVLDPRLAAELVDLGQPEPIPASEYFGACLWQMVKALHSPYKSVMKLALLEKYSGKGVGMRLLCDRIKEAVMRGRSRPEWVDPYLALFATIRSHYADLGDEASLGLLTECLWLKADVDPEYLPPEFSRVAQANWTHGTFANSLRLGGLVNQFMIAAYRRIQGGIRADRAAAMITPKDLTRLGRRIAANFAQHEHKVSLVPFLSEDVVFTELFFYAEKAPGKRTVWAVKGKEKATGKATVESLEPIRRDTDVARLLSWVVVNGIYVPGMAVQAEKSLAPIAVMDVQALLTDLTAFFPRREILEPDMEEYLQDERVTRAYVILNLPVPPDKNKIIQASVIYSTNWGEVFCQGFDNPPQLLTLSPLTFLRENLARPVPPRPEVKIFIPKKSACPRIKV